jgi:hypothetical protein
MASYKRRKIVDSRWCEIEIEYDPGSDGEAPRLSICGSTGRVITAAQGKREALAYWESYFDDNKGEIIAMGERFGKRLSSAKSAARFVVATDGAYHGLDVHAVITEGRTERLLITEACGQIRDELREWFPEFADLMPYHLSDMVAGAPDQEAALASAPKDWWRALPGGKYGPDFYSHACMALALGGILFSKYEGEITIKGRGTRIACAHQSPIDGLWVGGYRYGTGWVETRLPDHVTERIRALFAA